MGWPDARLASFIEILQDVQHHRRNPQTYIARRLMQARDLEAAPGKGEVVNRLVRELKSYFPTQKKFIDDLRADYGI